MSVFARSFLNQVLETLGARWLCVVLCFALVMGGVVTVVVVNQIIGRKPMVEWVSKGGVVRVTFPASDKK